MRNSFWIGAGASLLLVLTLVTAAWTEESPAKAEGASLRIGTFDSRAIAIVYYQSEEGQTVIKDIKAKYREAEAASDEQRMEELETHGITQQDRMHRMGFGNASVSGILDNIADSFPALAEQAQVDLIVSKWDVVYSNPAVEIVDVTEMLIELFHPDKDCSEMLTGLAEHPPLTEEELDHLDCDH